MAKLKAPLLSLGASGAIGKALVFFGWKGLDVVREYVIPANPRTDPQNTQRGYMTTMVNAVHTSQAIPATGLDAEDIYAYALWASVVKAATTWFNQVVKQGMDQLVALQQWVIWNNGHLTPGANTLTFIIAAQVRSAAVPTTVWIRFGTSKTALIHVQATTLGLLGAGVVIPGLTTGLKYYAQVEAQLPGTYIGSKSGIYYGYPT